MYLANVQIGGFSSSDFMARLSKPDLEMRRDYCVKITSSMIVLFDLSEIGFDNLYTSQNSKCEKTFKLSRRGSEDDGGREMFETDL